LSSLSAGYKWPQFPIHRGQLQLLLLRAVCERIGIGSFRSGLRLMSFEQSASGVTATFRDGETGTMVTDNADLLVGADGIHSTVIFWREATASGGFKVSNFAQTKRG
jgi:5-methylphenazine-1-carboxylate 1-monooxygenase